LFKSYEREKMSDFKKALDPKLDLLLESVVDISPELVWKAWTTPEYLKEWFCPKPWQTTECEIDLRSGGLFRTVMKGPDGIPHENIGCYLEVEKNRKLVWTDALEKDYRPNTIANSCIDGRFTAFVILEPHKGGTKYTVIARHGDEASCKSHAERGFEGGWGTALEQLVAYMKSISK
jgi:uncharacterized protein YndB with AHSA1/START domain